MKTLTVLYAIFFMSVRALVPCNDYSYFPKTFGSPYGDSQWTAFTSDTNGNFAVGGSADLLVLGESGSGTLPIIEYYQVRLDRDEASTTDWLLWSKYFNHGYISSVQSLALNPQGEYLAVQFVDQLNTRQRISIVDTSNGSIINSFLTTFFGQNSVSALIGNENTILFDQLSQLYIAGTSDQNTWQLGKFSNNLNAGQDGKQVYKLKASKQKDQCSEMYSMMLHPSQFPTEGALGIFTWNKLFDGNTCKYGMIYINSNGYPIWSASTTDEVYVTNTQLQTTTTGFLTQSLFSCGYKIDQSSKYALWILITKINPSLGNDLFVSSTIKAQQDYLFNYFRVYETANSQCYLFQTAPDGAAYSLIQVDNQLKITYFNSGKVQMYDVQITDANFNQKYNSGLFKYFPRPTFDKIIEVGYYIPYYDNTNAGVAPPKKQAYLTFYDISLTPAQQYSECSFKYEYKNGAEIVFKAVNTFSSSQNLQDVIQQDSATSGLDNYSGVNANQITTTSLQRWYCSPVTVSVHQDPVVSANRNYLDQLTQDIAKNQTIMTRIFDEMIVKINGIECLAKIKYYCKHNCDLSSFKFIPDQRLIIINPVQFYTVATYPKTITIRGEIPALSHQYYDITLNVFVECKCTVANIVDPYSSINRYPMNQPFAEIPPYIIGNPQQSYQFDVISSNASCCQPITTYLDQLSTPYIWEGKQYSFEANSHGGGKLLTLQDSNNSLADTYQFNLSYLFGNNINNVYYKRQFIQIYKTKGDCNTAVKIQPLLFSFQENHQWIYDVGSGQSFKFQTEWTTDNPSQCEYGGFFIDSLSIDSKNMLDLNDDNEIVIYLPLTSSPSQSDLGVRTINYWAYEQWDSKKQDKKDFKLELIQCQKYFNSGQNKDYFIGDTQSF